MHTTLCTRRYRQSVAFRCVLACLMLMSCRWAIGADLVAPRLSLEPRWIDGGGFWYVHQEADGGQLYRVVAGNPPVSGPLFDHARLAAELDRQLGGVSDPRHLPIGNVDVAPERIAFDAGGRRFSTARQVLALTEVAPAVAANPPTLPQGRSPDGRWVAEVREHNLWLRQAAGEATNEPAGATFALTTDGTAQDRYENPLWSPDGTRLAALRVRAGERRTITLIESSPPDQVQPKVHTIRYDKPGDRIDQARPCLFVVAERRQIPVDQALFENSWSVDSLAWRADSSGFTLLYNQRGHQLMRVLGVARDGDVRIVLEEKAETFFDYYGKCFLGCYEETQDLLWMSERDGWNHLYRFDLRTGALRNRITQGAWVVRSVDHVDPLAGQVWFSASGVFPGEDPYHLHVGRVSLSGGEPVWLTQGDGTHVVSWSPDRRWLIDSWSRVDLPPRHVLRDGRDGRQVLELESVAADALRAAGWVAPERFVAKGRDGVTDIHGLLWLPKGFDASKRYPVIEDIYTSPHSSYVPKAFKPRYRQQHLADLGFVVAKMDGMGTSHRSKAFQEVCWKNLGDAGFPDRIAWLKSAAAKRPWLDLTRVGISGSSAGGQSALGALLSHPEFYHVAVADCGCHDNRMDKVSWNEQWMGWPVGPHYAEQSNVTNAHKLQGKLMLVVGELDNNVDPSSTFQVANALQKAGKDFELVIIHGQGHGAVETPFGLKKRADFFVRHLLGSQP